MPVFQYQGKSRNGKTKKGTVTADTKQQALRQLRDKGINVRHIKQSSSLLHMEFQIGGKLKNQDFVVYCRQFATLIRSGVSVVESTTILAEQAKNKSFKAALHDVATKVRSGQTFSEAASKYKKIFPPLFINMMRVGEATGNLDETLEDLAVYYEKQFKLKKSIQSAMIYPVILLVLILGVGGGLLLTIVPQFADMFSDFGAELPTLTLTVLAFSDWLQTSWWIILIFFILIPVSFKMAYDKIPQVKYTTMLILFKIPIFGDLLQKSAIAQLTRTMASLLKNSVSILEAITIADRVVGNVLITEVMQKAHNSLEIGQPLSGPLKESWIFPPLVTQMVAIGEETGALDYMFDKVADFYEDDVERSVEALKSMIEPMMILVLAVVVGTIVMSIMLPMFSLFEQVG